MSSSYKDPNVATKLTELSSFCAQWGSLLFFDVVLLINFISLLCDQGDRLDHVSLTAKIHPLRLSVARLLSIRITSRTIFIGRNLSLL